MSIRSNLKHFNRGRILVITLAVIAIVWILVQQFVLRNAACLNQMCPVHDYSYVLRLILVIAISSAAFWLFKNPKAQS